MRRTLATVVVLLAIVLVWWATEDPPPPEATPGATQTQAPATPPVPTPASQGARPDAPRTPVPGQHPPGEAADPAAPASPEAAGRGAAAPALDTDGTVAPLPATSVWPITREGLSGALEEATPHLADCYERALAEVPDLAGKAMVLFLIEAEEGVGRITTVSAQDEGLDYAPLRDCVEDVTRRLSFDPPASPLQVTYPLVFRPDEGAATP